VEVSDSAEQAEAVAGLLPSRYRLPLLVLDATGMRVGELEALCWGDVDEPRGRWRVATSKTGRPRWVTPPPSLLEAVLRLCPRDDRHPDRRVFETFTSERFRTTLTRACTAAACRRSRRTTTARTYTHVVVDERELDYEGLLR
jgi:integrase